ncbi:MAG TPA: protein adenylyltransferase SelO family protein, partial [Arenimonas sp.]|nr:protein adenylyltransferase SelO family protein [Arenimonas sp.]
MLFTHIAERKPVQPTFSNQFVSQLSADPVTENNIRQVHHALWSMVQPTPVLKPKLVLWSEETARLLSVSANLIKDADFINVLGGNAVGSNSTPYATVYGGHQFGHWAGQLGDGRAINLGEIAGYTMQLKG